MAELRQIVFYVFSTMAHSSYLMLVTTLFLPLLPPSHYYCLNSPVLLAWILSTSSSCSNLHIQLVLKSPPSCHCQFHETFWTVVPLVLVFTTMGRKLGHSNIKNMLSVYQQGFFICETYQIHLYFKAKLYWKNLHPILW